MEDPILLETNLNSIDTRKRKIPCRRELLIFSLQRFYSTRTDLEKLIPILKGDGDVSLRLIDWFVTNYAKKHHVSYLLSEQEFVVYLNYKSQLKAFSKKLFDPFCRRERIMFQCGTYESFETTVGQLNFFRWAFEKNILEYIRAHFNEIISEEKLSRSNGTQSSTDSVDSITSTSSTVSTASTVSTLSSGSSISASTQNSSHTANSNSSKTTRRRRTEKMESSTKMMHKHEFEIKLTFD
jgi:hypothetical protein